MEIIVIEAVEIHDREHCFDIRIEVFCGEQKVSREVEFDGLDNECRHYLALLNNVPAGTARARPIGDRRVKFERIAVRSIHRGKGLGTALMLRALENAAADGAITGVLNAQVSAALFYEKLGFVRKGTNFLEAKIEHVHMVVDI
jgi:predicted GNAT family N-acyltransferase